MSTTEQWPPPQPFPSISELGRCLAGVEGDYWRVDETTVDEGATFAKETAMAFLTRQEDALRDLISNLPAQTMVDAAIQIGAAYVHASQLDAESDWQSADQGELRNRHAAIYRLMISVLPVVARAAGLTMAEMGWGVVEHQRATQFGLKVLS